MDKKYKIRKELLPFLENVLNEKRIDYSVQIDGEINYINTTITGSEFHKAVEDALCIEQQKGRPVPVLPYRIIINDELRTKALKKAACACYTVLFRDLRKVEKRVWQI